MQNNKNQTLVVNHDRRTRKNNMEIIERRYEGFPSSFIEHKPNEEEIRLILQRRQEIFSKFIQLPFIICLKIAKDNGIFEEDDTNKDEEGVLKGYYKKINDSNLWDKLEISIQNYSTRKA